MKTGWISIHRRIQDHWIYEKKRPRTKYEAWIDILLEVNHKTQKVLIGNDLIPCRKGQSLKSLNTWAKQWKWNKSKVRRFFTLLQKDNMIVSECVQGATRLSVVNYEPYQNERNVRENEVNRKCSTPVSEGVQKPTQLSVVNYEPYKDERNESETQVKRKRNASETQVTPNNNDNNDNNVNKKDKNLEKKDFSSDVIFEVDFFISTLSEKLKPTNLHYLKWCKVIKECNSIDKYSFDDIHEIIDRFRNDNFWSSNFMSPIKLRKINKDGIKFIDYFSEKLKNDFKYLEGKPKYIPMED